MLWGRGGGQRRRTGRGTVGTNRPAPSAERGARRDSPRSAAPPPCPPSARRAPHATSRRPSGEAATCRAPRGRARARCSRRCICRPRGRRACTEAGGGAWRPTAACPQAARRSSIWASRQAVVRGRIDQRSGEAAANWHTLPVRRASGSCCRRRRTNSRPTAWRLCRGGRLAGGLCGLGLSRPCRCALRRLRWATAPARVPRG